MGLLQLRIEAFGSKEGMVLMSPKRDLYAEPMDRAPHETAEWA